jgi:hypothetical protein
MRQRARAAAIRAFATEFMATNGRFSLSTRALTQALHIGGKSFRDLFTNMHGLFANILHTHIDTLEHVVACAAASPGPARRAAYVAASRTQAAQHAHLLLRRDRHLLPAHLLADIEAARAHLGALLAGPQGELAMDLLDNPILTADRAESMLAVVAVSTPPAQLARAYRPAPQRGLTMAQLNKIVARVQGPKLVTPMVVVPGKAQGPPK